jgi:hypothetical protein
LLSPKLEKKLEITNRQKEHFMGLKDNMMNSMMESFFKKMTSEEKQSMMSEMMDKFFSTMTQEEKQNMMQNMMPKMMSGMMGDNGNNPMSMMGMMGNMMSGKNKDDGNQEMPWDMCKKMMSNINKSTELAVSATPEIRQLFEDWARQIEEEILAFTEQSKTIDIDAIQKHFKLTKESVLYFLNRLAQKEKINFKI